MDVVPERVKDFFKVSSRTRKLNLPRLLSLIFEEGVFTLLTFGFRTGKTKT